MPAGELQEAAGPVGSFPTKAIVVLHLSVASAFRTVIELEAGGTWELLASGLDLALERQRSTAPSRQREDDYEDEEGGNRDKQSRRDAKQNAHNRSPEPRALNPGSLPAGLATGHRGLMAVRQPGAGE